mmetsp:Transcript_25061/g.81004  ORF Transcript_25061/g.81004 Transcript_25061/m.81004 type:complete len:252 (-) Transcript_25061:124-879(-)
MLFDGDELHREPGEHHALGPGPPRPPQALRDRRGPPQRDPGFLLRAHGLALRQEAPGRPHRGPEARLLRLGRRRLRHVPEAHRPLVRLFLLLRHARPRRVAVLGRKLLDRLLRRGLPPLRHRPPLHLARQLRRPLLRRPPLRRILLACRKRLRILVRRRRGMAQLAPPLPLRLRRLRIRHLLTVQHHQTLHRLLRRPRPRLGPQASQLHLGAHEGTAPRCLFFLLLQGRIISFHSFFTWVGGGLPPRTYLL